MPTFKITTSSPAAYYWYFEVEADSQEEAERMVLDGEVECYDSNFDVSNEEESIVESYEA